MNNKLLEQIGKLFESHTAQLRKEIQDAKTELKETISNSQEDTIDTLTTLINEGYNNHEERIHILEEKLNSPHSSQ